MKCRSYTLNSASSRIQTQDLVIQNYQHLLLGHLGPVVQSAVILISLLVVKILIFLILKNNI